LHDSFSFLSICKNLLSGKVIHIKSAYIIVTAGILGRQFTSVERGIKGTEKFTGITTYGGRMNGVDSAVGHTDLSGKVCCVARLRLY
jgi:hypothetical protein